MALSKAEIESCNLLIVRGSTNRSSNLNGQNSVCKTTEAKKTTKKNNFVDLFMMISNGVHHPLFTARHLMLTRNDPNPNPMK